MAKKTTKKKAEALEIWIDPRCLEVPRRMRLGNTWVAIGGDIDMPDKPPKLGYKIPEATIDQYLEISKISILVKIL